MFRIVIANLLLLGSCYSVSAQYADEIRKVGNFAGAGIVENIQPGEITIRRSDGKQKSFLIQNKDERFLSIDGDDFILPMPSRIDVYGSLPSRLLEKGMVVKFECEINRAGRIGKPVAEIQVIAGDQTTIKIKPERMPSGKAMVPCEVIGIVQKVANHSVYLLVPKSNLTPNERLSVKVAKDAFFDIRSDDLNRVQRGDKVVAFRGDTLDNGKMVIRDIRVELSPERSATTISYSDRLFQKYSRLSDEVVTPREIRSEHFILNTDVSPRSAKVLLEKLETMFGFLSRYYGGRPHSPILCYVVAQPDYFSGKIPKFALDKIKAKSGLTQYRTARITNTRGRRSETDAIVYSCDDHDIVQHEAVHAFCSMVFGQVGPVWYAEGMAEMGQYFVPNEPSIQIEPVIIEYLKNSKIRAIESITASDQMTGDSWKEYAWRWALCKLMADHPSYSRKFRELGTRLMLNKPASFSQTFKRELDRIRFEYGQFVSNIDNGYQLDICRWEWPSESSAFVADRERFNVKARMGWQATSLMLERGQSYDFVCPKVAKENQFWQVNENTMTSANGNASGDGMLVGAILTKFNDAAQSGYELSESFEIGAKRLGLIARQSGQLYVRCRENWDSIADNSGELNVLIRKSPE